MSAPGVDLRAQPTPAVQPNRWLLTAAIIGLLATMAPVGLPASQRWMVTLENACHGFLGALLALVTLDCLRCWRHTAMWSDARRYWAAFAIAMSVGALTEIAQLAGPRTASMSDLVLDFSGMLAVLSLIALGRSPRRSWLAGLHALCLAVALGIFATPLTTAALAYRDRTRDFPVLAGFDSAWSTYFISGESSRRRGELPTAWQLHPGEVGLRVDFPHSRWPRVNLTEIYPDWSHHGAITFDLGNPMSDAIELTVRIQDAAHDERYEDRFNTTFLVPPNARRQFTIPLTEIAASPAKRRMDLTRMTRLSIYRDQPSIPGTIYLIGIRLE